MMQKTCPHCHRYGYHLKWCRNWAPEHPPLKLSLRGALTIIWTPDLHPLEDVAEAALVVLETSGAESKDVYQASYLVTTFRRTASM
jgi:hypothetical protein